jgi:hypothetical protein
VRVWGGQPARGHSRLNMDTLPVKVHDATQARVSASELQRFETILDAADAACGAGPQYRRSVRGYDLPADDAEGKLNVVLGTVYALCGGALPPAVDASKNELLTWTTNSIVDARKAAVHAVAANNLVPGMDPEHVAEHMELVRKLNRSLGGEAH